MADASAMTAAVDGLFASMKAAFARDVEQLISGNVGNTKLLDDLRRENSQLRLRLGASGDLAVKGSNTDVSVSPKQSRASAPRQSEGSSPATEWKVIRSDKKRPTRLYAACELREAWNESIESFAQQSRDTQPFQCSEDDGTQNYSPWIVNPTSPWFLFWQMLFAMVLTYELLFFPMMAFDIPKNSIIEGVAMFNVIFWTCDLALTFFVGYYTRSGELILKQSLIARRYAKTWLVPDIMVVLTDWLDVVGASTSAKNFKMLRFLRVGRVLRLLRLRKLKELMQLLDDYMNSEYFLTVRSLFVDMLTICVIAHFLGCIWYTVGSVYGDSKEGWVSAYKMEQEGWEYAYLTSWHWSICQFTPGSIDIQPRNAIERIYNIVTLVLGMVIFSTVLGNVTLAMKTLKNYERKFDSQLTILRRFFRQTKLSTALLRRVCIYSDAVVRPKMHHVQLEEVQLMKLLPAEMHKDVFFEMYARYLVAHPLLNKVHDTSRQVFQSLCEHMKKTYKSKASCLFASGEVANNMYFIADGLVLYSFPRGFTEDIQIKGDCSRSSQFLEVALWTRWVCRGVATAVTDGEFLILSAEALEDTYHMQPGKKLLPIIYARAFMEEINQRDSSGNIVSDLFKMERPIEPMLEFLGQGEFQPHEPPAKSVEQNTASPRTSPSEHRLKI